MAQLALIAQGESAKAVLGSCIGLVLYHETRQAAAVAHIVLPRSQDRGGPPGKFADTAIPHMLQLLTDSGIPRIGLLAKLAGGANMFGSGGPIQIGKENHAAVIEILKGLRIPLVAEHVGGQKGRRMTFNSGTGEMRVDVAGAESIIL